MPKWLKALPAARAEWRRVCAILSEMGVLMEADRGALTNLVMASVRLQQAEEELQKLPSVAAQLLYKTPSGCLIPNPLLQVVYQQVNIIDKIGAHFGLSPASRARLVMPDQVETAVKAADEMEAILAS